ncbi:MAG: hypothetical protein D4R73_09515 [Deltaproteobacteria bacterium]|nr:MAG: hypothetical protein D4R73_09515 [Deltaproteobacteria bacterium]
MSRNFDPLSTSVPNKIFLRLDLDSIYKISPDPSFPKRGINGIFPFEKGENLFSSFVKTRGQGRFYENLFDRNLV